MTNELLCRCYLMYLHQHHPGLLRMHAATVRPKLNTVNNLDDFTSILKSGKELHLIWIRTRITATRNCLKLKRLKTDRLVSYEQLYTSQLVNWCTGVVCITCELLWCFNQLFGLSFWRHPFTAEDTLLGKWWNATFLQNWWRNKLIYILDGLIISKLFHY